MSRNIRMLALVAIVMLAGQALRAQVSPAVAARLGFPQTIFYNGKIVSMDDPGYNTNPGRIYQAMAVKKGRIMGLGTTEQIRAMANSATKVIDVGGLTVLPGIVESHIHLFGGGELGAQMGVKAQIGRAHV